MHNQRKKATNLHAHHAGHFFVDYLIKKNNNLEEYQALRRRKKEKI
jgi:hypothetical protein